MSLWDLVGLVKFPVGIGGIGYMFCRNWWDWSRVSAGAGGIVKTFCRSMWDWANLLCEGPGFVGCICGRGGIGQNFRESVWDHSTFLHSLGPYSETVPLSM